MTRVAMSLYKPYSSTAYSYVRRARPTTMYTQISTSQVLNCAPQLLTLVQLLTYSATLKIVVLTSYFIVLWPRLKH